MEKIRAYIQTSERVRKAIRVVAAKTGILQRNVIDDAIRDEKVLGKLLDAYREYEEPHASEAKQPA